MRYILNDSGYIEAVSYGCTIECEDKTCTEYTGTIPEGYETLAIWSETANINAYKIVDGNLTYDSEEDVRLQAIWESQLSNSGTNATGKTTIFSGALIGGESVTLSGVKRYLDIYYRMNFASGDGMGKYTIEIAKDSIEMYSSGIIMAFDGSSGQEYYVSEGLYNQQTKVFTHTRIGYFNISTGQFTSRNNNDSYYIYQIDTYD